MVVKSSLGRVNMWGKRFAHNTLLVPGERRLLLPRCQRRQREVKQKTALTATLIAAPLSLHITQISLQTSPLALPLHVTLLTSFLISHSLPLCTHEQSGAQSIAAATTMPRKPRFSYAFSVVLQVGQS